MKHFGQLVWIIACFCYTMLAHAAGIVTEGPMLTSDFWLKKNDGGERVILTESQIDEWNQKIREASPTVVKLSEFPEKVDGAFVRSKISKFDILKEELYLNGQKTSDNYKNILKDQCNLAQVGKTVKVQYGIVVRRSALRTLPTSQGVFSSPQDNNFDDFQETMLDPGEGVVVLHTSRKGYFHFVQAQNYCGWISNCNLAFADRDDWLKFAEPKRFLVVTDKGAWINIGTEKILYQQGAKIVHSGKYDKGYKILLPKRGKDGWLKKVEKFLIFGKGVSEGYLPYTSNNLLRCAFEFNCMPYGWGGLKDSVDCSALIYNVYRCVGIHLPRNADEQELTYGIHVDLTGLNDSERINAYTKLRPGAVLYMDGHCFIFLGNVDGTSYVIHALASYYRNNQRCQPMQVLVSDLSLVRANGLSHLNSINQAILFGE